MSGRQILSQLSPVMRKEHEEEEEEEGRRRGTGGHCKVVTSVPCFAGLHRSADGRGVMQSGSNWCTGKPREANQGVIQVHSGLFTCVPLKN